ncbi:hypothetical protein COP1_026045 [Malus domestica]
MKMICEDAVISWYSCSVFGFAWKEFLGFLGEFFRDVKRVDLLYLPFSGAPLLERIVNHLIKEPAAGMVYKEAYATINQLWL